MAAPKVHRNVTLRRLALDFLQFWRCQAPVVRRAGYPFGVSRRFVEIDLTYRCNLRCRNCNRSCTQAPSRRDLPLARIAAFIHQSAAENRPWERIRLLGGEPTLHPEFAGVVAMLRDYRSRCNPRLRIVVCTNGTGAVVGRRLAALPADIEIKSTGKGRRQRLFRPFNVAPRDRRLHRWADYRSGCRILEDCGVGLTPQGYYPCAVAGAIDRVFGFGRGWPSLPRPHEDMREDLAMFCPLCGHYGFAWPTRSARMSATWRRAYARYRSPRRLEPSPTGGTEWTTFVATTPGWPR